MPQDEARKLPESERKFAERVRDPKNDEYRLLADLSSTAISQLAEKRITRIEGADLTPQLTDRALRNVLDWMGGSNAMPSLSTLVFDVPRVDLRPGADPDFVEVYAARPDGSSVGLKLPLTPTAADHGSGALALRMAGFCDAVTPEPLNKLGMDKAVKTSQTDKRDSGSLMFAECLGAIHDATGVPAVSDFYTLPLRLFSISGKTGAQAVKEIAGIGHHHHHWDGSALLFRNDDWPDLMPVEVPLRILERLRALETRPPNELHSLTLEQSLVAASLERRRAPFLTFYGMPALWARDSNAYLLLRFLATLSPPQWVALRGSDGLIPENLTRGQQDALDTLGMEMWEKGGRHPQVTSLKLRESVVAEPGKPTVDRAVCTFHIEAPDGVRDETVSIALGVAAVPKGKSARSTQRQAASPPA